MDIVVIVVVFPYPSIDFTIIIGDARRPQTHKHIQRLAVAPRRSLLWFRRVLFILHPRKRPHLLQQLLRHLDPMLFILPLTLSLDRVLSLVLFSVVQALDVVLSKLETRRTILRLCHALVPVKSRSIRQSHTHKQSGGSGSCGARYFASSSSSSSETVRSFIRSNFLLGLQNRSKIAFIHSSPRPSSRRRSIAITDTVVVVPC